VTRFGMVVAAALLVAATARAEDDAAPRDVCAVPSALLHLSQPLTSTRSALANGRPFKIVTLGSSSTAGAGASASRFSYPSRLAVALAQRYPGATVQIINRGINGEDAWENLARMDIDVLAAKPDLVIWQMGTNAVLRDVDYDDFDRAVQQGIDRLKGAGIEVLLMDLQYAPRVAEVPNHTRMLEHFDSLGERNRIPVFHRYAVMKSWSDTLRGDYVSMISSDGLHLNDTSYRCLAERLADAIAGTTADASPTLRVFGTRATP
jgi:acyl-CoA thioesterase I